MGAKLRDDVLEIADSLPAGAEMRPLQMHRDDRGMFCEVFRDSWDTGLDPVQWNVVRSAAGVLRGVHVHVRHDDYLVLLHGRATIGLRDLRRRSPSEGQVSLVEMTGDALHALTVPHGVAHGFYFHEPSTHVYSVTEYWSTDDELGCRWDDPALGIDWPVGSAQLSERDDGAGPFAELVATLEPFQPL